MKELLLRFLKGERARPWQRALSVAASLAIWLLLWQLAAVRLDRELLLPTPLTVLQRLGELSLTALFWQRALSSLLRVLSGILLGIGAATLIAALTAAFSPIHTLLRPLITVIKTTPVASFIILTMLWLDEDLLPIFISFLMVFPVIWGNLHTALSTVPMPYRELWRVYRLPLLRRIRRILAPSALPYFISACRSSLGLAWKAGIAAEVLALPALSIGKQLTESKLYLETVDLFAWTLVVILLSLVLEGGAHLLFSHLQRHQQTAAPTKETEVSA